MTTENIGLFQALGAKMNYLQNRQKVISQNIANANTPNYQPSDLSAVDFASTLKNVTKQSNGVAPVKLAATDPNHIGFNQKISDARVEKQKITYEVKPDKNGVVVEEQMMKASDTQMNYSLLMNVYRSNMDMVHTALDKRG